MMIPPRSTRLPAEIMQRIHESLPVEDKPIWDQVFIGANKHAGKAEVDAWYIAELRKDFEIEHQKLVEIYGDRLLPVKTIYLIQGHAVKVQLLPKQTLDDSAFVKKLNEEPQGYADLRKILSAGAVLGNSALVQSIINDEMKLFFPGSVQAALENTARSGNLALVKGWVDENQLKLTQDVLEIASHSGNLALVKYIFFHSPAALKLTSQVLQEAACSGNLALVKWIHSNSEEELELDASVLESAAFSGNLELVKWILDKQKNLKLTKDSLWKYACSGRVALMQWAIDQVGEDQLTPRVLLEIIRSRSLPLVRWVIDEKGFELTQSHLETAAGSGSQSVVHWMVNKKGLALTQDVLVAAAASGNPFLVKWILDHNKDLAINEKVKVEIMLSENVALKRWLKTVQSSSSRLPVSSTPHQLA